jgi:phosphoenolpyruvate mutase
MYSFTCYMSLIIVRRSKQVSIKVIQSVILNLMSTSKIVKIVYAPMSADIVHPGHLNVIHEGSKFGEVTIGLLTDEAIASKKRLPVMNYSQRYAVMSNIKNVSSVIPQATPDYRPNLLKLKPDYVIHGNDWTEEARKTVSDTISEWGGTVVEVDYTSNVSSTLLQKRMKRNGITPETRKSSLKKMLDANMTVRGLEAHNGLSALIVEETSFKNNQGKMKQFDAIWISSLTDSTAKGKPDTELIDTSSRVATINEVIEVSTKPIIFDGDSGGNSEQFAHTVKTLERLGVSAIVIEDKTGVKRNSFHDTPSEHTQEAIDVFAHKIEAGIDARITDDFMIVARVESLVLGTGMDDALKRAQAYIEAGASAIMIHSKSSDGKEIKAFTSAYNNFTNRKPLLLVPTTYNKVSESELASWGANVIIYANHLLRAAYPAMERTALTILENNRGYEAEEFVTPIEDFITITATL